MSEYDTTEVEGTDLEPRDARALTEYMTALPEGGDVYTVVGENGGTYSVDARAGRCTCPDAEYRDARCKHQRRVAFATGERTIPAWVDPDDVDAQLGEHTDAAPAVAATDGGTDGIVVADDDGEILDESEGENESDDGRPDDCQCWDASLTLPCFPCYREGFEEPNPETPGGDDESEGDDTPRRHEPADFGGGETTGVQDL